jgi:hypothetical protein
MAREALAIEKGDNVVSRMKGQREIVARPLG